MAVQEEVQEGVEVEARLPARATAVVADMASPATSRDGRGVPLGVVVREVEVRRAVGVRGTMPRRMVRECDVKCVKIYMHV